MARTKKTARGKATFREPLNGISENERSTLLQLMGLPREGAASAKTASANWSTVAERLRTHTREAAIKESRCLTTTPFDTDGCCNEWRFEKHPLTVALANERTPLTREALIAFISAYPDVANSPRSPLVVAASKNSVLCKSFPDILDILRRVNPHCCGLQRTKTFQLMGFSPAIDGPVPQYDNCRDAAHVVNWEALESHLRENPEEAKIVCPSSNGGVALFPLEVALHFQYSPPPLSTVRLLLQLCPEAVTIADSCALMKACSLPFLKDPDVIRSILKVDPRKAGEVGQRMVECTIEEQFGLPLHAAAYFLPCAAQVVPDLVESYPAALSDISSIYSQIPLQVAVRDRPRASVELIKILLQYGHRHKVGKECGRGQLFVTEDSESWMAMYNLICNAGLYREDGEPGRAEERFQSACLGFQAAGAFKTELTETTMWEYPLLQGAVEFARRQWIVMQILDRYTTQADLIRTDAFGRTPLAVAIEMAGNNDHHDPDEIDFSVIIQRLLNDDQNGSSKAAVFLPMNVAGFPMLPLHQALHQGVGLEDGSENIVKAYPEALSIPDPQSNLLPCLLAAVGERARVENIFGLMNMRPDLIVPLCGNHKKFSG